VSCVTTRLSGFAECSLGNALDKKWAGKDVFAEYILSGTQQSRHSAKLGPKKTQKNGKKNPEKSMAFFT
jgi:hypothetical protein